MFLIPHGILVRGSLSKEVAKIEVGGGVVLNEKMFLGGIIEAS